MHEFFLDTLWEFTRGVEEDRGRKHLKFASSLK